MFNIDTFNGFIYTTVSEVVQQNINLFNEASHGTIRMVDGYNNIGDTDHEAFFKEIPGLTRRRDAYGTDPVASKNLELGDLVSVKVAGGTPPIEIPPSKFRWIKKNPEDGALLFGEQFAAAMPQDQLNVGITAAVATMTGIGAPSGVGTLDGVYHDPIGVGSVSAATNIDLEMLNTAAGYYGDAQQRIKAWVLHSTTMTKLFGNNLANTKRLFSMDTVNVIEDLFGRVYFVTDSPALNNGDGTFNTLGLTENAIVIENNGDLDSNIDNGNGSENITRSIQAEWSFNVSLKGCQWGSSDASPTDAAIGTPANWSQVVTDIKSGPGVLIKHSINAS